jgi:hypothetical protein
MTGHLRNKWLFILARLGAGLEGMVLEMPD